MSIKFVCSCGKRLKAHDEMAGKRIPCPRCGNPVGVPALDPNRAAPMTPAERLRAQARRPIALSYLDDDPAPLPIPPDEPEPAHEPPAPATNPRVRSVSSPIRPSVAPIDREDDGPALPKPTSMPGVPSLPASRPSQLAVVPANPFNPTDVRQARRQPHRRLSGRHEWPLETHWYECWVYPFRAWPLMLGMTVALTVLTAVGALLAPRILSEVTFNWGNGFFTAICLVGPIALLGYACGFLDCVLASAAEGESRFIRWPGGNLRLVFRSLAAWTIAFLSAPAPLAVIGFYYWLYCGDPTWVDYVILGELGVLGIGYWLLAVLAVSRSERLRDANPWCVIDLAERLGWRALVGALLAGAIFLSHGLVAFLTTEILHDKPLLGVVAAMGCWLSWLFWATFLFRVVGLWCYYRRV
jgi:hypothetical protein